MSKGLTITLVASVLVLALGVAGLAGYVFLKQPAAATTPAPAEKAQTETKETAVEAASFLKLKNFVTDLADKDRLRYADVTIALGLVDEVALEGSKKMESQIRDVILSQLRTKVAADLAGAAGKEKLAEDLMKSLAPVLKKQLTKVYITDLVIQ